MFYPAGDGGNELKFIIMITTALRILLVEDVKTDVELISRQLGKVVANPQIKVVDNLSDFNTALHVFVPDVVISDYNMPTCNGLEVLELAQTVDENIPFIFLTGALEDEELAANTILAGATGFILKKNMKQLPEKLEPLLKQVVFKMEVGDEIREKIRRNKVAVNQIYQYLDKINADNREQQENLDQIRKNMGNIKFEDDDE